MEPDTSVSLHDGWPKYRDNFFAVTYIWRRVRCKMPWSCSFQFYLGLLTAYGHTESQDSVIGIVSWILSEQPTNRDSIPGSGWNFLFRKTFRPAVGPTQPRIRWTSVALFAGVKLLGGDVDQLLASSVKIKSNLNCTATPLRMPTWRSRRLLNGTILESFHAI